jgi:flagellar hook protein FlgE
MSKGEFMSDLFSALRANSVLLANASSNVANLNTLDYQSITTTITSDTAGAPTAATSRTTTPGVPIDGSHCGSNVELPREFCDMMRARQGFEAALGAISTREDMLNDLMDVLTDTE